MKKIIGLALALAAAALVFVGCSDSTGNTDTEGDKWDKTIKVKTEGEEPLNPADAGYRRAWVQLSSVEKVAGITTTIKIKKDGITTDKGNSGVVGLIFDYNDHAERDASGEAVTNSKKKDFGIVGINVSRSGTPAYYVNKNIGIDYSKAGLDSTKGDLVELSDDAKGQLLTGNDKQDSPDRDTYLGKSSWVSKSDLLSIVDWEDGSKAQDAYQVVVKIAPTTADGTLDGKGYDIFIGKDTASLGKEPVATYTVDQVHKDAGHTTTIKVNNENMKNIPCGGIAMYLNAKTSKLVYTGGATDAFTKIEANYKTARPSGGKATSFASMDALDSSSLVGDLKLTNTSNDNITVIVE